MSNDLPEDDRELEAMLDGLAAEDRELLLEEHRQLEKDLLRISDPLPPADFVSKVMAKVAAAPAPAPARADIAMAAIITFGAMAAGLIAFMSSGGGIAGVGVSLASFMVYLREAAIGLGSAFEAVWRTSALPVAMGLCAMLAVSVLALKRVGTEAKVVS